MKKSFLMVLFCLLAFSMVLTGCDYFDSAVEKGGVNNGGDTPAPASYTISFAANGGSGTMASVTVVEGASYTVPLCTFTAPAGKVFNKWNDGSSDRAPGDAITVNSNITLTAKWLFDGALSGEFSVSSTKKVHFSQGNMYWNGSSYNFYDNQYDYETSWDDNKVDHFFYSTSESIARAENYSDASASVTDIIFTNATETTPKSDFTVNGATGIWRSLSLAELKYLIGEGDTYRANAVNLVKYNVTVCGKTCCLVLAPDNWSGTIQDSYNAESWQEAQNNGLVCLSAAGYRSGSDMKFTGSNGYYWSSTPNASNANYAYILYFNSSNVYTYYDRRNRGNSVRLVVEE